MGIAIRLILCGVVSSAFSVARVDADDSKEIGEITTEAFCAFPGDDRVAVLSGGHLRLVSVGAERRPQILSEVKVATVYEMVPAEGGSIVALLDSYRVAVYRGANLEKQREVTLTSHMTSICRCLLYNGGVAYIETLKGDGALIDCLNDKTLVSVKVSRLSPVAFDFESKRFAYVDATSTLKTQLIGNSKVEWSIPLRNGEPEGIILGEGKLVTVYDGYCEVYQDPKVAPKRIELKIAKGMFVVRFCSSIVNGRICLFGGQMGILRVNLLDGDERVIQKGPFNLASDVRLSLQLDQHRNTLFYMTDSHKLFTLAFR